MVQSSLKLRPVLKLKLASSAVPKSEPLIKSPPAPVVAAKPPKMSMRAVLRILTQRYPNCFKPKKGQPKLPLKVGIERDILDLSPDLRWQMVQACLAHYVSTPEYRQTIIEGAGRVDLDGNPAGIVTTNQAAHATATTSIGG
jgi:ProP effector